MFQAVSCRALGDGEFYLKSDLGVQCDPTLHIAGVGAPLFHAFILVSVLFYPIGVPVLTVTVMHRSKDDMHTDGSVTRLLFDVFVSDYRPEFFYW